MRFDERFSEHPEYKQEMQTIKNHLQSISKDIVPSKTRLSELIDMLIPCEISYLQLIDIENEVIFAIKPLEDVNKQIECIKEKYGNELINGVYFNEYLYSRAELQIQLIYQKHRDVFYLYRR